MSSANIYVLLINKQKCISTFIFALTDVMMWLLYRFRIQCHVKSCRANFELHVVCLSLIDLFVHFLLTKYIIHVIHAIYIISGFLLV